MSMGIRKILPVGVVGVLAMLAGSRTVRGQAADVPPTILKAKLDFPADATAETRDEMTRRIVEVLRRRFQRRGVTGARIESSKEGEVTLRLAVKIDDLSQIVRLMEMKGELKFMLVATGRISDLFSDPNKPPPPGYLWLGGRNGEQHLLELAVHMTGDQIESASAVPCDRGGPVGGWEISFTLKPEGRKTFAELTAKSVDRRLAIVLDDQVQSAPNIETPITQMPVRITGSFKREEAENLAACLVSGELPCPVRVVDSPAESESPSKESREKQEPK